LNLQEYFISQSKNFKIIGMIFGGETWHLGNEKKGGVANGVKGKFFWEKNGCMQPCLDK
jgi:hypothetical protein